MLINLPLLYKKHMLLVNIFRVISFTILHILKRLFQKKGDVNETLSVSIASPLSLLQFINLSILYHLACLLSSFFSTIFNLCSHSNHIQLSVPLQNLRRRISVQKQQITAPENLSQIFPSLREYSCLYDRSAHRRDRSQPWELPRRKPPRVCSSMPSRPPRLSGCP